LISSAESGFSTNVGPQRMMASSSPEAPWRIPRRDSHRRGTHGSGGSSTALTAPRYGTAARKVETK
jgi:hypothetical protein